MKLFITSRNGIEVINLDKVVYLKADGNYTDFYFCDGKVRPHLSTLAVFDEKPSLRVMLRPTSLLRFSAWAAAMSSTSAMSLR